MNEQQDRGACIVVVEQGVPPLQALDQNGICDACLRAVVAQQHDETPAELALRVARRIERLTRQGTPLEAGVFVASDATDDDVFTSRCLMARAMLRGMSAAHEPRLVFEVPSTLSDAGRHELLALAGTLMSQLDSSRVQVLVRFADAEKVEAPASGVVRRVPAQPLAYAGPQADVA